MPKIKVILFIELFILFNLHSMCFAANHGNANEPDARSVLEADFQNSPDAMLNEKNAWQNTVTAERTVNEADMTASGGKAMSDAGRISGFESTDAETPGSDNHWAGLLLNPKADMSFELKALFIVALVGICARVIGDRQARKRNDK